MEKIKSYLIKNIKEIIIVSIIFSFGVFLYFYKLSITPASLYIDEVMPSYSAYSILTTGKDEYGKVLPLVFRFFGSYNPPLYIYATIIPVYIFGLNEFSARFVSVIFGLLSSLVFYFFIKSSKEFRNSASKYLCTLLFLLTPWIFFYSRTGYEVTLGYLLFSLGILLFYKALEKPRYYILGFLSLSLSTYAAYTERFLVPLFILVYFWVFIKQIKGKLLNKKYFIYGIVVSIASQIPNFYLLTTSAFFPKESLWSNYSGSFAREFFSKFATYFSPASLFFLGDPDKQRSIPELSVFYTWMILPYLIGIYSLWLKRKSNFVKLILILCLVSPIPSSLTKDPFSTHRALPLVLPLMLIVSLGIDHIISWFKKGKFIVLFVILLIILGSLIPLWRGYFVLLPKERAVFWGYGYKQLADEIQKKNGKHFIIDQSRGKPAYIYLTYYLKYPPKDFQNLVDPNVKKNYYSNPPFESYYNFSNIETRNIVWEKDLCSDYVFVGDEYAVSSVQAEEHNLSFLFEINDPVGNIMFRGYQVNAKSNKDCRLDN